PLRCAGNRSISRAATGSRSARRARSARTPVGSELPAAASQPERRAAAASKRAPALRAPVPKQTTCECPCCYSLRDLSDRLYRSWIARAVPRLECGGKSRFSRGKRAIARCCRHRLLVRYERRTAAGHSRTLFTADTVQSAPSRAAVAQLDRVPGFEPGG